ncbi:hypothetical protein F0562_031480 [Nyssa sinensis]|uniref:WRKY domain-containing protein n=1 Tax=Nyssa sinensis TaxID=561372 RepID=A0A5J5ASM2_9ASTE|nr:hypothetical protein F0562_031480 [Nyssa sinensis]
MEGLEKFWTNRERVIGELLKGRDLTTQLRILLQKKPFSDHGSGDRRSEDSGESSKTPELKDRRGCYKRRKSSDSRIKVSPTMEDGYAWRKYGQKAILNAKYPRCYFRCTHKNDQGCGALKQVQIITEDPIMYQITYFGHHTCKDILNVLQIVSDSDPVEPYLLSFKSKIPSEQDHHDHATCQQPIYLAKQEFTEETQSTDLSDNNMLSLDSILWPDLMAMETSSRVYSCATSTSSDGLDMDFLIKSVDFDNDFHFEEI